jgi:hypothetical protein
MAIRLLVFLIAVCWSVDAVGQGAQFPPPPLRPEMPRPEWAPPNLSPTKEGLPGTGMPGADPFQLLENSSQIQAELGLTSTQLRNIHLVAVHNQGKLEELSHRLAGQSPEQMLKQIDEQRRETKAMIARELTAKQNDRLQQIMLQLEGPCMAILDREIARHLGIGSDQGQSLATACQNRSKQMRRSFKPAAPGEDFCAVEAENHVRIEQIRLREDQDIAARLQPQQRAQLTRMMGQKIELEPPIPPNCRR